MSTCSAKRLPNAFSAAAPPDIATAVFITPQSEALRRRFYPVTLAAAAIALALSLVTATDTRASGAEAPTGRDAQAAVGTREGGGAVGRHTAPAYAQEAQPHPEPAPEQGHAPAPSGEHADPEQHTTPKAGGAGDEHGGPAGEHGSEAAHESPWSLVARLTNFAILAGVLVYLLRSPLAQYLADRSAQVRRDLIVARDMRETATRQLQEIDRRLQALPGEIDTLKARGTEEIAAEEQRIAQAAAAERERLLEQTRREIDLQLRAARRELMEEAANLSVGIATERIKRSITTDDQLRLVDRYLEQVKHSPGH
jgi:F-type H+-transporting ATPase subunit b